HRAQQNLVVVRLLDEVDRACFHRLHGKGNVAVAGDDNDRQIDFEMFKLAHEFEAIDLWHLDVGDDAASFNAGDGIDEYLAGGVGANGKMGGREQERHRFPRRVVIVYDMDYRTARHPSSSSGVTARRVKRKIDPPPGLGSIVICPPCDSMMVREIDNPIPMP